MITALARQGNLETFQTVPYSHILSKDELKRYSIDFTDDMYGETILPMDPGCQIAPSGMGLNALPGMHGFATEHDDSFAALLSTEKVELELDCVDDHFRLMTKRMNML